MRYGCRTPTYFIRSGGTYRISSPDTERPLGSVLQPVFDGRKFDHRRPTAGRGLMSDRSGAR
jgi:hypothetical protein